MIPLYNWKYNNKIVLNLFYYIYKIKQYIAQNWNCYYIIENNIKKFIIIITFLLPYNAFVILFVVWCCSTELYKYRPKKLFPIFRFSPGNRFVLRSSACWRVISTQKSMLLLTFFSYLCNINLLNLFNILVNAFIYSKFDLLFKRNYLFLASLTLRKVECTTIWLLFRTLLPFMSHILNLFLNFHYFLRFFGVFCFYQILIRFACLFLFFGVFSLILFLWLCFGFFLLNSLFVYEFCLKKYKHL